MLSLAVFDKSAIDPAHNLDLLRRSGDENDAIGLDAFVLASSEVSFGDGILIDKAPAQTEACGASWRNPSSMSRHCPAKTFVEPDVEIFTREPRTGTFPRPPVATVMPSWGAASARSSRRLLIVSPR